MTYLCATLHTLGVKLGDRLEAVRGQNREAGITTLEMVFWGVALLSLAGIVYAVFQAFINNKISGIR